LSGALALVAMMTVVCQAQPMVYPGKGQTPEQQQKDMTECQAWAKNQAGTTAAPAQAPPGPQGERAKGAARGAAVGAVAGAAGGDAGKGAAAGAAAGVVAGGVRQRQGARQQAAAQQQQTQAAATNLDKAIGACMEGRGYTVK
jgi:hypothetical protein